jgi:hypothetical protein
MPMDGLFRRVVPQIGLFKRRGVRQHGIGDTKEAALLQVECALEWSTVGGKQAIKTAVFLHDAKPFLDAFGKLLAGCVAPDKQVARQRIIEQQATFDDQVREVFPACLQLQRGFIDAAAK